MTDLKIILIPVLIFHCDVNLEDLSEISLLILSSLNLLSTGYLSCVNPKYCVKVLIVISSFTKA